MNTPRRRGGNELPALQRKGGRVCRRQRVGSVDRGPESMPVSPAPMFSMADLERAREWWVRQMGYLSTTHDRKIESLAEEFAAVREQAAKEAPGVAALLASAVDAAAAAQRMQLDLSRLAPELRQTVEAMFAERAAASSDAGDLSVLPVPRWAIDEAKRTGRYTEEELAARARQPGEGLTHSSGAWHSQPPPTPPVVHTGPVPGPVEEVVQALYGWFYRCDCKPSIVGGAVGRGPERGKPVPDTVFHTPACQAKRGAAMQVFAEALSRLRGPGDGLVCRCVFDRECPIHGGEA
jgi:hypothetical protein